MFNLSTLVYVSLFLALKILYVSKFYITTLYIRTYVLLSFRSSMDWILFSLGMLVSINIGKLRTYVRTYFGSFGYLVSKSYVLLFIFYVLRSYVGSLLYKSYASLFICSFFRVRRYLGLHLFQNLIFSCSSIR